MFFKTTAPKPDINPMTILNKYTNCLWEICFALQIKKRFKKVCFGMVIIKLLKIYARLGFIFNT